MIAPTIWDDMAKAAAGAGVGRRRSANGLLVATLHAAMPPSIADAAALAARWLEATHGEEEDPVFTEMGVEKTVRIFPSQLRRLDALVSAILLFLGPRTSEEAREVLRVYGRRCCLHHPPRAASGRGRWRCRRPFS
jgi:hypothetical protein